MKKNLTIPNIISAIRIVLIPIYILLYFSNIENNHIYALIVLIFSALSDIVDGFIARKFNMISDLGKVLDPIADKLTQVAVVIVLCFSHQTLIPVLCVLFTKELLTAVAAAFWFKSGKGAVSARWWGKVSTALLYASFMFYMVSDILSFKNFTIDVIIMVAIIACLLFSMCGYIKTVLLNSKQPQN